VNKKRLSLRMPRCKTSKLSLWQQQQQHQQQRQQMTDCSAVVASERTQRRLYAQEQQRN